VLDSKAVAFAEAIDVHDDQAVRTDLYG